MASDSDDDFVLPRSRRSSNKDAEVAPAITRTYATRAKVDTQKSQDRTTATTSEEPTARTSTRSTGHYRKILPRPSTSLPPSGHSETAPRTPPQQTGNIKQEDDPDEMMADNTSLPKATLSSTRITLGTPANDSPFDNSNAAGPSDVGPTQPTSAAVSKHAMSSPFHTPKAAGTQTTNSSSHTTDIAAAYSNKTARTTHDMVTPTPTRKRKVAKPKLSNASIPTKVPRTKKASPAAAQEQEVASALPSGSGVSGQLEQLPYARTGARRSASMPNSPTRSSPDKPFDFQAATLKSRGPSTPTLGSPFAGNAGRNMAPTLGADISPAHILPPNFYPPNFDVPKNIWSALEKNYTENPPIDMSDQLYQMGIQYGIGLGISSYKSGLMEELSERGTLFGRRVALDPGRTAFEVQTSIQAQDFFDRVAAGQAFTLYQYWLRKIEEQSREMGIDQAIANEGGFIGSSGLLPNPTSSQSVNAAGPSPAGPSTPSPATRNANARGAASIIPSNGMPSGSQVPQETADAAINNLPASFTGAGTTYLGVDMTNLDGPAGMVANAFNMGNPNMAQQRRPMLNQQDQPMAQHAGNTLNNPNRRTSSNQEGASANIGHQGVSQSASRFHTGYSPKARHSDPKDMQPVLTETKRGRAVIKTKPRDH